MDERKLLIGTVTPSAHCSKTVQLSLLCHCKPVKTSEIEGNQVRSKIGASYWLARGYAVFSCACRNGKNGFQDRRIQPLCHSFTLYRKPAFSMAFPPTLPMTVATTIPSYRWQTAGYYPARSPTARLRARTPVPRRLRLPKR